jgi:nucleoid-associated protein YgaU
MADKADSGKRPLGSVGDFGGAARHAAPAGAAKASNAPASSAGSTPLGHGYTVQPGDSLSKIAKKIYGEADRWKEIWEANRAKIPNPDLIHPGLELQIPPK